MKWVYRIIRTILVSSLFLAVGIPIFLYLALWLGPTRAKIRQIAQSELSELLGARVDIGSLEILPFTRLQLGDISIVEAGDTILKAEALNAGISGRNLLRQRLVITDVELMSPDIRVNRDSIGAPLNVQPIFDRLKGDSSKPPTHFNLAVHTVVIRNGSGRYDVLNLPHKESGFDVNHIRLHDLDADLTAPKIANSNIRVSLKRLSVSEESGLRLRKLAAVVNLSGNVLSILKPELILGETSLKLADMSLNLAGNEIGSVEILRGSKICAPDFSAFHPSLAEIASPIGLSGRIDLMRDSLIIRRCNLSTPRRELFLNLRAEATTNSAKARMLNFGVKGDELSSTLSLFVPVKKNTASLLSNLGEISFKGSAGWSKPKNATVNGVISTRAGVVDIKAFLLNGRLKGLLEASNVNLAAIFPEKELGPASFDATFDLSKKQGHAAVSLDRMTWRGHTYRNCDIQADYTGKSYAAAIEVDDSLLRAEINIATNLTPGDYSANVIADIAALSPSDMGLLKNYPGYMLSGQVKAQFSAEELLRPTGQLLINNLRFLNADGKGLREAPIALTTNFALETQNIALKSDLIEANMYGQIDLKGIVPTVKNLLAQVLPYYFTPQEVDTTNVNNFILKAKILDDAPLFAFLNPKMKLLYPADIMLNLDSESAELNISAPYIQKGNSLISRTEANIALGRHSDMRIVTQMPSKFGDMDVRIAGALDSVQGNITLEFGNHEHNRYAGGMTMHIRPLYDGFDANIAPGTLTLGNVDWKIEPAFVGLRNGMIIVHGFGLNRPGQELTINGVASKFPEDRLIVKLDNVNVDYIFRTLQMAETLQFGGDATGTVTASALLSKEPILQTERLYVKGLKYGGCVMGNANIRSRWNNETRGIELYANVDDPAHNGSTTVDGKIYIVDQKLDFLFHANHTPTAFLHTFMSTWASDVGGTASGDLHLFGTFKDVNLEGDAVAENFSLTVGYTGVTYYATDTVRIRPGIIDLSNILLRDRNGHTGVLSGQLTHTYFKEASFNFHIGELDNILVLDTQPSPENDRWYGRIYANGTADIIGYPGFVKIAADASTAPGSDFTFALTDAQSAAEYTFLTFRDVTPALGGDSIIWEPGSKELDNKMRRKVQREAEAVAATNFALSLTVNANTDATMNLIMDPNAGDKISGVGTGTIAIGYSSANDQMTLRGIYKIERGEYNFSIQDIILKNFTIRDGSTVEFNGDPMNARLNISAINQVTANLSDLDESFLTDKEVQRTVVPVYAVLNVIGNMQAPEIKFDIELPTLTADVNRKVKSIINTDELMSRQIIYLLVLNRFYTPEYMAATKGNDLMSVASGTLSSQLSNILGQLSDKISVAPSIRTESENFSDLEVDVALSSNLLNNRLLLNGNFGYRDKSLNNNQFIGDFDVEYLLTRRGNWRLKAYNHFNDRNLYVKTALTTQGLGIVFKHDFDNLFRKKTR